MRSNTLRPALAAGLSIAAFGVAAATLPDAVVVSGKPALDGPATVYEPSATAEAAGVVLLLGLLATALYTLGRRGFLNKRRIVKLTPILVGLLILVLVGNHLLFGLTGLTVDLESELERHHGDEDEEADESRSDREEDTAQEPGDEANFHTSVALFAALLLAIGGILVYEYVPDRDDDGDDQRTSDDAAGATGSIARTAGDAADRIEETDETGNEIYRAWREMAALVDVADPQTSTPAEFADAAVEEGLDPEHVSALTDLFEAVRYGDRSVTEEREQRAIEAFRAIEREHAPDGGEES